ncbi:transcriptional regulator, AraC family [Amphritea atlantica]|uniref:Transcriptional regulator, AraC family n=1 Tax=Amphritea atlantica TaxID=355243 RepID=A0A1H9L0K3_9GAMM|nr:AraC family transcriptional regulator [Amphritea atlantica]SER04553.1 transcriptional regulator, AraC family [Amphritea atlantica]
MSLKREDPRISRVCDYINQNLDIELSIEQLSGVAALSKYHFHRLFSAFTGVSVVRFIQLMRLKRASFRLAFEPQLRIIDIAYEAGFDSPEAFSRAFKRTFGQSPSGFRASPEWPEWHSKFQFDMPSGGVLKMNVEIVDFTETPVALVEHKGPREQVLDTVGRFVAWRKETGLSPVKTSQTFGVPYSDPNTTKPEDFRFDVCGSFAGEVPDNSFGVKSGVIPGGRCAVVQHRGSHDNIDESIYYLYRNWLPDSGEELRDYPCFFQYRNFIHEVDECDLLTDIFLPLK